MKHILLCAALVLGTAVSAYAQNAANGLHARKIRLNDAYVDASCALAKATQDLPDMTDVSPEKLEDALKRRMALEEQYKDALSRPYPPELENYTPAPFEYAEHLLTGLPCEEGLSTKAKMPAGFRCRLDQMIFRDPTKKRELKAEGGNAQFVFVYEDDDERKTEEKPRALKAGAPRVVGFVLVRGNLAGKSYTVIREWTGGSPVEALTSRETNGKAPEDAVLLPTVLPYVTAENAAMFVFDLKNDTPAVREMSGRPLKEFRFVPYKCQQ